MQGLTLSQSPIWVWNMKNVLLLAFMKRVLVSISYMGMEQNLKRYKIMTTNIKYQSPIWVWNVDDAMGSRSWETISYQSPIWVWNNNI